MLRETISEKETEPPSDQVPIGQGHCVLQAVCTSPFLFWGVTKLALLIWTAAKHLGSLHACAPNSVQSDIHGD